MRPIYHRGAELYGLLSLSHHSHEKSSVVRLDQGYYDQLFSSLLYFAAEGISCYKGSTVQNYMAERSCVHLHNKPPASSSRSVPPAHRWGGCRPDDTGVRSCHRRYALRLVSVVVVRPWFFTGRLGPK